MKIFKWQAQWWTKEIMKTSCLNWREVEWYLCLNGNKPQIMFVPADFSKWSIKASALMATKLLKPTKEIFPLIEKQEGGIGVQVI